MNSLSILMMVLSCLLSVSSDTAADDTVERVVEFLSTMVRRDRDSREGATPPQLPYPIRGPYLGRLELLRILKDRNDVNWNKVLGKIP